MVFSDKEIAKADAILAYMKEYNGDYVDSTDLYVATGRGDNVMRNVMAEDLGLLSWHASMIRLTEEGRIAAEMGFGAWLEQRAQKRSEPLHVKNVKTESEKRLEKWMAWGGIIGGIAAAIDILLRLLGLF